MPIGPVATFADLQRRHLEVEVVCQKCGHRAVVDPAARGLAARRVAGARFRCGEAGCGGIGLPSIGPSIGAQRSWKARLARHARTRGTARQPGLDDIALRNDKESER